VVVIAHGQLHVFLEIFFLYHIRPSTLQPLTGILSVCGVIHRVTVIRKLEKVRKFKVDGSTVYQNVLSTCLTTCRCI